MGLIIGIIAGIAIGAVFAEPIGKAAQRGMAWIVRKFDAWRE